MPRASRLFALLVAVCAAAGLGASVGAHPAAAASSQAVVIVDTGSATYARVITFSGTISGFEALVLAGADPVTYGYAGQGAAICRLFGAGNDPGGNSCLGTPDDPKYWAYHRVPAGAEGWQYSRAGAGATRVGDGDVEGWRFGIGVAPGFRSFCSVAACAAPAPDPAPGPGPAGGGPAVPTDAGGSGAASASGAASGPGSEGATSGGTTSGAATSGDAGPTGVTPPGGPGSAPGAPGADRTAARRGVATGFAAPPGAVDPSRRADPGSPVGVVVAGLLTLAIAGLAWAWRRRAT